MSSLNESTLALAPFAEAVEAPPLVALDRPPAADALADSERKFRSLFEMSWDAILLSDREKFLDCNPAAVRMFGCSSKEELLGTHPSELCPPAQPDGTPSLQVMVVRKMAAFQTGRQSFEFQHRRKDGSLFQADVLLNRIEINGQPVLQGVIRDVSARKQVEAELAFKTSLLEAESETTLDGLLVVDPKGRVVMCNRQFQEIWNIPSELRHTSDDEVLLSYARNQVASPEAFLERVRYLYAHPEEKTREEITLKDGRALERYSAALVLWTGEIVGRIWYFRDITARKEAEARLAAMHRELVEVSRQAGMAEVATSILHNVGNVLNSVNVTSSLLVDRLRKSKLPYLSKAVALVQEHQDDLASFLTADPKGKQLPQYLGMLAERLGSEQADQLRELASLREDMEHIKQIIAMQQGYARVAGLVEPLALNELVEDALRINSSGMEKYQIHLVRQYGQVPLVHTEKHKVLQILVNLLSNAKNALKESNTPDRQLIVRTEMPRPEKVSISVIDNGPGIAEENKNRIFELGFTTRKDGHGFGLHNGALIARELGGSLSLHSPGLGQGATFTLELPCRRP